MAASFEKLASWSSPLLLKSAWAACGLAHFTRMDISITFAWVVSIRLLILNQITQRYFGQHSTWVNQYSTHSIKSVFMSYFFYIYIYILLHKNAACCVQSWTSPGSNTPQDTNCTATCPLSRKLFKLDEPDMQDTAGEAEMNS